MPPSDAVPYLAIIISPVYRTVIDESAKYEGVEDLKALGQEVLDTLQKHVGVTQFTSAFNTIRSNIAQTRQDRKEKRVTERITEPKIYAKRKLAINEKKKERKKRKVHEKAKSRIRNSVTGNQKRKQ